MWQHLIICIVFTFQGFLLCDAGVSRADCNFRGYATASAVADTQN